MISAPEVGSGAAVRTLRHQVIMGGPDKPGHDEKGGRRRT